MTDPIRTKPFPQHPTFDEEAKRGVLDVLSSGVLSGFVANSGPNFLGGPKVKELEAAFCDYFGVKYAMTVNSATAGLHAAVAACGIGPGDEVIVPPYTMSASASAVLMQSAVPLFADIQDDIYCVDPKSIEERITSRTKAIIVVHLFGHPADMDSISKIAKKHGLKIIEDCAQAPGVKYKNKFVGTIGDIGVFSFNQHKTITTGEGGVVITNSEEAALKVRLVRNHGEAVLENMEINDYSNTLGWNYRMTELEAAVGITQFKKLDTLTKHKQELANVLNEKLKKFEELSLPVALDGCSHGYFVYPMKWRASKTGLSRDQIVEALNKEGIPFGKGYVRPLYLLPLFQKQICFGSNGWPFTSIPEKERQKYKKGLCPVAERMYEKELMLTGVCYWPVTKEDIMDVVKAFEKILKK